MRKTIVTDDEVGRVAWDTYSKAVGGKAYNGDPLPTWDAMCKDEKKENLVVAWKRMLASLVEKKLAPPVPVESPSLSDPSKIAPIPGANPACAAMPEARVQIMELDKPTCNGRIYPRGVVEAALAKLNGQSLAVIHVNSFRESEGVPKVADSLGVASNLAIDDSTNMVVVANVKIDRVPDDLKGGYVVRSAGIGTLEGNTVTEFTMTAVVIGKVPCTSSCARWTSWQSTTCGMSGTLASGRPSSMSGQPTETSTRRLVVASNSIKSLQKRVDDALLWAESVSRHPTLAQAAILSCLRFAYPKGEMRDRITAKGRELLTQANVEVNRDTDAIQLMLAKE